MYGEENVFVYNPASDKFKSISRSRENSKLSYGENTKNVRRTTEERNRKDNKTTKELDNSSFFIGIYFI